MTTEQLFSYLETNADKKRKFYHYAIIDAAQDEKICPMIMRSNDPYACLFLGNQAVDMASVAPYLIQIEKESAITQTFIEKGWNNNWGIVSTSEVEFDLIKRHFRKFITVQNEEGKMMMFRFYDPRVLRTFLPLCLPDELNMFFGPVKTIYANGEENQMIIYTNQEGKLKTTY
jgi:hypothetical protein